MWCPPSPVGGKCLMSIRCRHALAGHVLQFRQGVSSGSRTKQYKHCYVSGSRLGISCVFVVITLDQPLPAFPKTCRYYLLWVSAAWKSVFETMKSLSNIYCMSHACMVGDTHNMLTTSENRKMSARWGSQSSRRAGGSVVHFERKFNK